MVPMCVSADFLVQRVDRWRACFWGFLFPILSAQESQSSGTSLTTELNAWFLSVALHGPRVSLPHTETFLLDFTLSFPLTPFIYPLLNLKQTFFIASLECYLVGDWWRKRTECAIVVLCARAEEQVRTYFHLSGMTLHIPFHSALWLLLHWYLNYVYYLPHLGPCWLQFLTEGALEYICSILTHRSLSLKSCVLAKSLSKKEF